MYTYACTDDNFLFISSEVSSLRPRRLLCTCSDVYTVREKGRKGKKGQVEASITAPRLFNRRGARAPVEVLLSRLAER